MIKAIYPIPTKFPSMYVHKKFNCSPIGPSFIAATTIKNKPVKAIILIFKSSLSCSCFDFFDRLVLAMTHTPYSNSIIIS